MSVDIESILSTGFYPSSPPAEGIWQAVYLKLTAPGFLEYPSDVHRGYISLIMVEVLRKKWDSRFRVTGASRGWSKELKLLGVVGCALIDLLTHIQLMVPEELEGFHQAQWFGVLMLEAEAIGWGVGGHDFSGKEDLMRYFASQNRRLRALENPYTAPHTHYIFDKVTRISKDSDQVAKTLRAYANARSKLTAQDRRADLRHFRLALDGSFSVSRQGRKKDVSESLTGQGFHDINTFGFRAGNTV
jgi:hypothetical protein